MTHSLCYRIYKGIEKIYVNSKIVNCFSKVLSYLFTILISSKLFAFFTIDQNGVIFQESFLFKGLNKIANIFQWTFGKISCLQGMIDESFLVGLFKGILEKKEKAAINTVYLLIALSLLFNIMIKIATGSFILGANKGFILFMIGSILLYVLKIDYKTIIKKSKVIRTIDKILNDKN